MSASSRPFATFAAAMASVLPEASPQPWYGLVEEVQQPESDCAVEYRSEVYGDPRRGYYVKTRKRYFRVLMVYPNLALANVAGRKLNRQVYVAGLWVSNRAVQLLAGPQDSISRNGKSSHEATGVPVPHFGRPAELCAFL